MKKQMWGSISLSLSQALEICKNVNVPVAPCEKYSRFCKNASFVFSHDELIVIEFN